MTERPEFLIVEDDAALARSLARIVGEYGEVSIAPTVQQARYALTQDRPWAGVVLDLNLPDGFGLDLLTEIRAEGTVLPVMVLTGEFNRELVNSAQALRAEYVCKPASPGNLLPFIKDAIAQRGLDDARIGSCVDDMARSLALTPREKQLMSLSVQGLSRRELAETLGVAENTVKAQTRSLLKKTGARSLAAVGQDVLRRAADL